MGNTSTCHTDVWALTGNVAGIASLDNAVAGASYHTIPAFKPFNRMSVALALPMPAGVAGISAFRFGDDLYNEHVLSFGFANKFGLASLGMKVNYIQLQAQGVGTRQVLTASFGGIATITPVLLFGAHIININQPVINELTGERIATTLAAGALLRLSEKFAVNAELEKHLLHEPILKAGLEYKPFKKIAFRTGFNFNPQSALFGLGFRTHRIELSYALQTSYVLGMTHQATVNLPISK